AALQLALGLRRFGIGRGDRVAVQLPNWSEFALWVAAIARLGAVIVPIMPIYRDDDVAYVLAHSGAKVAVTCEEFKKFRYLDMFVKLRSQVPDLQLVVVRNSGAVDPALATAFDDLLSRATPEAASAMLGEPA